VSRRTTIGLAGAGLLLLSGCDSLRPRAEAPAGSPSPEADPDAALVESVLAELTAAVAITAGAGMARLEALHRAHITALAGEQPQAASSSGPGPAAVRRVERRLRATLVRGALAARSGALARALASMAAAVAQEQGREAAR